MTWADTDTWCVRARCDAEAFSFFSLLFPFFFFCVFFFFS